MTRSVVIEYDFELKTQFRALKVLEFVRGETLKMAKMDMCRQVRRPKHRGIRRQADR